MLLNRPPSEFVNFLIAPGLETSRGPVALSTYVSTGGRSPNAVAVKRLFERALARHPRAHAEGVAAMGLSALHRVHASVVSSTSRESSWRRLFTGQGEPSHLVQLWDFILRNAEYVSTLELNGTRLLEPYLSGAGNPIAAMVRDEIFGCDCLGFVGNYLAWEGFHGRYPEFTVEQYVTRFGFVPIRSLEEIVPLCVLLWPPGAGAQHIAIVNRVHRMDGDQLMVDICQSSSGGPQTNTLASIIRWSGSRVSFDSTTAPAFKINLPGSPPAPVTQAPMGIARHPDLQLVRPGT